MKKLLFALIAILLTAGTIAYASLSDDQKAQKREELEKFFATALTRTTPEKPKQTGTALVLTARSATRFGYESNVDLDDREDGDWFYEQKFTFNAEYAAEHFSIFGKQLAIGVDGRYSYLGYFDRDDLNRHSFLMSPYLRLELSEYVFIESAYELRGRIYDDRDDLSYYANGLRSTIQHNISSTLNHRFTFRYESRDYTDREYLFSNGIFSGDEREDERYEIVYGLKKRINKWTLGVEGSWVWNESNDEYFDYNDYEDGGLEGSIQYRFTDKLLATAMGGWHNKQFDSRAVAPTFSSIQDDDWFYGGGRLYYAINTSSGVDLTFVYYENNSNNNDHEYDSTITSVGYHLYF